MRYTRLNYGTISAQDIFDKTMDDTIEGLDGILHIRDDFIIYGGNNQEHDDALKAFLLRFCECGLTLNPKKCKFRGKSGSSPENEPSEKCNGQSFFAWHGPIFCTIHSKIR
jgi:hypothetical protein